MNYEKGSPYIQLFSGEKGRILCDLQRAYLRHNILPLLAALFSTNERIAVLEFGPGIGVLADLLHEEYSHLSYTAVDIDSEVLRRIRTKFPGSHLVEADSACRVAQQLQANSYDVVVAIDVWEHLPPNDLERYTKLALELRTKRGVFVAQVPNWGCPFTSNTIFAGDLTHCNRFNELSARQLLLRADVPNHCIRILPHRFPPLNLLWRARSLLRASILLAYQLVLIVLGLYRIRIATPNLIIVVNHVEMDSTSLGHEPFSEPLDNNAAD